MQRQATLALYAKYTAITCTAMALWFGVQAVFIEGGFNPRHAMLAVLSGLVFGLVFGPVWSTVECFRLIHHPRMVPIFVKYTGLTLLVVGIFFGMQVLVILKKFEPHYAVIPLLLGLMIGLLISVMMMFKQKFQENNALLAHANDEIGSLNHRLQADNLRMGAELSVTRQLQQMLLPTAHELAQIEELDIAGFMEPAEEVGGDYYDVLRDAQGRIKIGIGDVTGHGLESGVLMLMVQMAVRTLLANDVKDPVEFLNALNRAVFENVQRMDSDKNLTLALIDYQAGILHLTGQHEEVLVVRKGGEVERIDTTDLGFMVGLQADITRWVGHSQIYLAPGDGVVLYTDGITEAMNPANQTYGVERLCNLVGRYWKEPARQIIERVVADVKQHVADGTIYDDITLLVCKQR